MLFWEIFSMVLIFVNSFGFLESKALKNQLKKSNGEQKNNHRMQNKLGDKQITWCRFRFWVIVGKPGWLATARNTTLRRSAELFQLMLWGSML